MKIFCLIISVLFSCKNQDNIDKVSDDINKLSNYLELNEFNPISVKWDQISMTNNNRVPGPNDYQINVVLKLNDKDYRRLYSLYEDNQDSMEEEIYLEIKFQKKWFSKSINNCFVYQDDYLRINKRVFPARKFLKSPYVFGWLFFAGDNEIFVFGNT